MSFAPLIFALALAGAPAVVAQQAPPAVDAAVLPLPTDELVAVREFSLDEPRAYHWMKDHPPIREGLLLAIDAEPALCLSRQVAEPVIYLGGVPAERLAADWERGRLLLLVPGAPDLAALPLHFGTPVLPERIDLAHGEAALAAARAAGLQPFTPQQLDAARAAGGDPLALVDERGLERAVADWIDAWAPAEADRADGLRAPDVE